MSDDAPAQGDINGGAPVDTGPTQADPPTSAAPDAGPGDSAQTPGQSGSGGGTTEPGPTVDAPSNTGTDAANATYVVGTPGSHPRLIMTVSDPAQASMQEQSGEVCFEITALPSEPYAITADGTALETVAVPLADLQANARRAARAAYEDAVALYPSSIGVVQTDEASQNRIIRSFVNAFFFFKPTGAPVTDDNPRGLNLRWRLADNSFSPAFANITAFIAFATAALDFGDRCQANYWSVVDQIQAATTADQLTAIDVKAGYPTS